MNAFPALVAFAALAQCASAAQDGEAKWIGVPDASDPAVAKSFEVSSAPKSAVLKVTGVGYYEAQINGRKVGKKVLDPTPTDYLKRIYYSTYDVTGMIRAGKNEIHILLGNGLYNVQSEAAWEFNKAPWRGPPRGIAKLEMSFTDGTMCRIVTDSSWHVVASPVAFNDFREGEVVLSRPAKTLEVRKATVMEAPGGRLVPEDHPAAEIVREYPALKAETMPDGSTLYDFGFNVAGWSRIKFSGLAKGDVVSIRYDERHPSEGKRRIDQHVLKLASPGLCKIVDSDTAGFQTDRFVSAGVDGETYEPRFTYNGFRYIIVKGCRVVPSAKNVVACFVRTAFPKTGSFWCDSETFNKLVAATELAYEGNFTDGYPTDCPHREKNGWLGDAAAAIEFAQYAYGGKENAAAYTSWLRTIADQQKPDGRIASIAPTSGWGFNGDPCGAGPAWGIALTTIPYALHRFHGDTGTMRELYPAMRRYSEKLATTLHPLCTHGLGDWVAVKLNRPGDLGSCRTTIPFTSSAYAYRTFREMREMAETLGKGDDAAHFKGIAEKLRGDFNAAFYKGDGRYENGYACGQAMALEFGLVPEGEVKAVRRRLVEAVHAEEDKIDFGLLGSTVVFRALSEAGETDLAWKMIMNDTYPGFAHWIKEGATTLWESWKGGSSRNHVMFGDFAAWAYAYLAGVKPLQPGFAEFEVRPHPPAALGFVKAKVPTPHGTIAVEWTKKDGEFALTVEVPNGTKANVVMPSGEAFAFGPGRHTRAERQVRPADGFDYVDSLIGTEGSGSEYGGMMPYTGVPFGSFHMVPMTRLNRVGQLSFNQADDTLIGFILTRQPAIWMGDWGEVRIPIEPAKIESADYTPYMGRVTAGGRTFEYTATAHAAWLRGNLKDIRLLDGYCSNRDDENLGCALPNFKGWRCVRRGKDGMQIGVSLISLDQARRNLAVEIGERTFEEVVAGTKAEWERYFSRVEIDAPDDVKTIF